MGKGRGGLARLRIESLAVGGKGVARLTGGEVVFVPGVLPGELVEVDVSARGKLAEARLLDVIEPSADRVRAPCVYVDTCGGCDWMHLSVPAQERGHAAIVASAIARAIPSITAPEVRVHPAPAALAYRTRARLFARVERRRVKIGYRVEGTHRVAEISSCAVLHPSIDGVLGDLAAVLEGASGEGDVKVARGQGGLPVIDLAWRGDLPGATWAAIDARVKQGSWAGARVVLDGATTPATFGDPGPRITGADGAPLRIAPGGFAQASDEGAAALARRVAELAAEGAPAEASEARGVLELFAGSGTLSVLLARGAGGPFTAVEIDADAASCARQNLADRALAGKVVAADADAFAIPQRTGVVVLDPPRAGAFGAAKAIAASSARTVVYVACDPATLARDLAVLVAAGFAITDVETFELFPQTSHVEVVARLARTRRARS